MAKWVFVLVNDGDSDIEEFGSIVVGEKKLVLAQILSIHKHIHKVFWFLFLNNA